MKRGKEQWGEDEKGEKTEEGRGIGNNKEGEQKGR